MKKIDSYKLHLEFHVARMALSQMVRWYETDSIPARYEDSGLCSFLECQAVTIAFSLRDFIDFAKWDHFSGNKAYPVADGSDVNPVKLFSQTPKYSGEYGDMRIKFAKFLIEEIYKLLRDSEFLYVRRTPLKHPIVRNWLITLLRNPDCCIFSDNACKSDGLCLVLASLRVSNDDILHIPLHKWRYYSGLRLFPVPAPRKASKLWLKRDNPNSYYAKSPDKYEGRNLKLRQSLALFILNQYI